jgi:hypothetical protein
MTYIDFFCMAGMCRIGYDRVILNYNRVILNITVLFIIPIF